jgi:hypothetical protein
MDPSYRSIGNPGFRVALNATGQAKAAAPGADARSTIDK